jgi:TPR repeat protein
MLLTTSHLHAQTAPSKAQPFSPSITLPDMTTSYLPLGVKQDAAYGAFQRGQYATALHEAMHRLELDQNDAPAMTLMGELYKDGLGVKRDLSEAAHWYKLGADHGDRQAQFIIGMAYLEGKAVERDPQQAIFYLTKAADQGHGGALYNLGLMALDGPTPNDALAITDFQRASAAGDLDALYALAIAYREGRGVERDPIKATQLLRRGALEHHVASEVDYAIALFNGDGVTQNATEAAHFFLSAAAKNNPIAANRLARLYATGNGVNKDMVQAMKWHVLARAAGVKDDWLDAQFDVMPAKDKEKVENEVRKFIGN